MENQDSEPRAPLDDASIGDAALNFDRDSEKHLRIKFRVSALEADVAYFQARIELLGKPSTLHQRAQYNAYRTMEELLRATLRRLRRNPQS